MFGRVVDDDDVVVIVVVPLKIFRHLYGQKKLSHHLSKRYAPIMRDSVSHP